MSKPAHPFIGGTPWQDATGRFSLLKTVVLACACAPAIWMAIEFTSGRWDFPSPYVNLIYHSGLWATYLLLASLAVSPLRRITGWGKLAQLRRLLGVSCFFYTAVHVVAWLGLRAWDTTTLVNEAVTRPSLWVASAATLVLFALTVTSVDAAIRVMGAERWKRLHSMVYAGALLAVLHFLMSPGSLQGLPFLMAGAYVWLMGWRWLDRRRWGATPGPLALLGIASALFSMLLQPLWLTTFQAARTSQTPWQVLADNFSADVWIYLGVPPVWLLLAWTVLTVAIAWYRARHALPHTISRHRPTL